MSTMRALLLFSGIFLIAHVAATPGTQLALSGLGGFAIGAYVTFSDARIGKR